MKAPIFFGLYVKNRGSVKSIFLISLLLMFPVFTSGCFSDDVDRYLEDLKNENIVVRKNAVKNLGKSEDKKAAPVLTQLLIKGEPEEIRVSAVVALGKIGEESSVDALVGVLAEKDKKIRTAAIEALGRIQDPKAVKPLIDILNDKDVRLTAIWALGHIGDKGAVPALTDLLDSEDEYVRYNAAQALKKLAAKE